MKLQFMGTGAAGPREYNLEDDTFRGYASVLLDEKFLIDCGSTIIPALSSFGINTQNITDILLTHSHSDHFNLDALCLLTNDRVTPIRLWGPVEALKQAEILGGKISLCPLRPGDKFSLGTLQATALEANHETEFPSEKALHYFFETNEGRTLVYALDGAWFLKSAWQFLRQRKIDAIIWDFTIGDTSGDWRIFEHNSLEMIKVMTATFREDGVFSNKTQVILSHMNHTICSSQKPLQKKLKADGFKLAFDGMLLEI